ncbi:MAG: VCBS repeat-containing protein [Xanthomonadales bacterium]|nr:VCBS repeat-containing protein [Xanthomonadales bacterium]
MSKRIESDAPRHRPLGNWTQSALVSLALAVGVGSLGAQADEMPTLPRFVAGPLSIDCSATPFGLSVPLAQDIEGVNLVESTNSNFIDEYRATSGNETPPFVRTFRAARPTALNGASLQRAVGADLDGNGRDEVVAAYRMGDGSLRLAVYKRNGAAVQLADTWSLNQTFSQVDLAAGDLNGSANGREEIGVMLRTMAGAVQVYVLQGDVNGNIAQPDTLAAGSWQKAGPVGASVGFTAGDVLLDGHDQLVVVSEINPGSNRDLHFDVLEYEPTTSALPVSGSSSNIGSALFVSDVGGTFGNSSDGIIRIEADAGDVVDSATAELVLHIQHRQSSFDYITQRLTHFTTARDENNHITGIALYDRTPGTAGDDSHYDASRQAQGQNENGVASFEATLAQVGGSLKREIVLARSNPGTESLTVEAFAPTVDAKAGFTYVATGTTVNYRNSSTGGATGYSWNFGDGTGALSGVDVTHQYPTNGTFTTTLTATYPGNVTRTYATPITIPSTSSGGVTPTYSYGLGSATYAASYAVPSHNDLSFVNVAAGDMNRDGTYEVLTMARNTTGKVLRSRWQLGDPANPASFAGTHAEESNGAFNAMSAMELVGSDFDGDSIYGTIGSECLMVFEPQVRQIVWMPPYFGVEQASATKLASWGQSTTGSTSTERQSGSYTSNDVSGYIGIEVGTPDNLPYTVEASLAFTAGRNWQKASGEIHGEESSLTVDEGYYLEQGEALLITEENAFNCYSYNVNRFSTNNAYPESGLRMCDPVPDSRIVSGGDARGWDTYLPAASVQLQGHKPAQWFPVNRDWASVALFKTATTNVAFAANSGADKLTDGRFDTEALAGAPRVQPYVEIDLGQVRDVANIRVFPATGDAIDLQGFRVYASRSPMPTTGVPSGAGITQFGHETEDQVSYDRWNIWTRDPLEPSSMLRTRFIRVQHPGASAVNLRISEIQVFGDVHVDPPFYPQSVCDPVANDGQFKALVWNAAAGRFAEIQMRGDLLWSGAGTWRAPQSGDTYSACSNHGQVPMRDIWSTIGVGGTASHTWNLSSETGTMTGAYTSIDNSYRVGAQFDFKAGFIAKVIAGVAYEYTKGINRETQSSTYWGTGLEIGGEIGGFANAALNQPCRYRPRPFAYTLPDRSDTGYLHEAYAVDYVVQEGSTGFWTRANVPTQCFGDRIFADSFE